MSEVDPYTESEIELGGPFGGLQNKLLNPMHYCVTISSTLHKAEREQLDSSSRYEPYRYTMIKSYNKTN